MKNTALFRFTAVAAALMFVFTLYGQEKTTVTVRVEKDGKVVKDTTYQFDDATEAEQAMKMMDIMCGDDDGEHVKVIRHKCDKGDNVIVLKTGDGETFDILIDDDDDGGDIKKQVKVVVTGDEGGEKLEDGDEVKVIVVTKKENKDKQ